MDYKKYNQEINIYPSDLENYYLCKNTNTKDEIALSSKSFFCDQFCIDSSEEEIQAHERDFKVICDELNELIKSIEEDSEKYKEEIDVLISTINKYNITGMFIEPLTLAIKNKDLPMFEKMISLFDLDSYTCYEILDNIDSFSDNNVTFFESMIKTINMRFSKENKLSIQLAKDIICILDENIFKCSEDFILESLILTGENSESPQAAWITIQNTQMFKHMFEQYVKDNSFKSFFERIVVNSIRADAIQTKLAMFLKENNKSYLVDLEENNHAFIIYSYILMKNPDIDLEIIPPSALIKNIDELPLNEKLYHIYYLYKLSMNKTEIFLGSASKDPNGFSFFLMNEFVSIIDNNDIKLKLLEMIMLLRKYNCFNKEYSREIVDHCYYDGIDNNAIMELVSIIDDEDIEYISD